MSTPSEGELFLLKGFIANWREALEANAQVVFECAQMEENFLAHHEIANTFVQNLGFEPIAFNWELLDSAEDASGSRSATNVIAGALEKDMVFSHQEWLGRGPAHECANGFVDAFNPARRTILSNRLEGLWNPISKASIEWAFVGFDDQKIALLLVMAED